MIKMTLRTDNCDPTSCYKLETLATAHLEFWLEFDRIVSVQSQKASRDALRSEIEEQLRLFEWMCAGTVSIELLWYLHGTQRQETDKVGDIDNITKPIIDALTGEAGLLIDDSQIGSLHTSWNSRNHHTKGDALYIRVEFNNDECLRKDHLIFVQYAGPVCVALEVNFSSIKDMLGALLIIRNRRMHRRFAARARSLGENLDRALVVSAWDYHRTRLGGFSKDRILSIADFRSKCCESGLSWRRLLSTFRESRKARK